MLWSFADMLCAGACLRARGGRDADVEVARAPPPCQGAQAGQGTRRGAETGSGRMGHDGLEHWLYPASQRCAPGPSKWLVQGSVITFLAAGGRCSPRRAAPMCRANAASKLP